MLMVGEKTSSLHRYLELEPKYRIGRASRRRHVLASMPAKPMVEFKIDAGGGREGKECVNSNKRADGSGSEGM